MGGVGWIDGCLLFDSFVFMDYFCFSPFFSSGCARRRAKQSKAKQYERVSGYTKNGFAMRLA